MSEVTYTGHDAEHSVVSAETANAFAEQMRARGLDPTETLARYGYGAKPSERVEPDNGNATPKADGTTPKADPPPVPIRREQRDAGLDIDPTTGLPRFTAEQTAALADNLRKFWSGDPAVLEAALAGAGAPAEQPIADTRTEAERSFDGSTLASVKPEEYELNGLWVGHNVSDRFGYLNNDLPAMEASLRSIMSKLSVPKAVGRQFAEDMIASSDAFEALSNAGDEAAAKQYYLEQSAAFARVTKVGWQEAAAQMKPWLAGMSEETREFLAKSGATESVAARVRLWQAYQLAMARSKMGKVA
ncbi:MAG TPA: hypothetical protein VKY24_03445 [Reyranella sp.]|nr:hypothetical protein [Reyranella sp.]